MTAARRLRLDIPPRPHDYLLGAGLLRETGREAAALLDAGPCLLVTDERIAAGTAVRVLEDALDGAGFQPARALLPAGERAKTIEQAEYVWQALAGAGVERGGAVFALGGGSVGDLAGFCAATWMRGVALVHVPTTLLAMADSAVGGKAAVNLPFGKNLVGAVHPAQLVVADLRLLDGLPDREISSGLAEVAKCAVLAGGDAFERIRSAAEMLRARDPGALSDAIEMAVRVKEEHVRDDLHDLGGRRALLNLGHTTAHALEVEAGYGVLRHGEAVAIGLVVAARLAGDEGLEGELRSLLPALGLPVEVPGDLDPKRLVERTRHDKKRRGGSGRLVLPTPGGGARLAPVSDADLLAALTVLAG